ncbi:hypothetical protein F0562_006336 [Nyssa sinensis]|uniref:Zinc finger CCCH domain-containing protein 44 n=1 Tax=Nyssa sinensis TaxID=561372 RepID=A0A5J5ARE1_9ASTE|nr:hypothetical protein F0562_006336 [Nyssa sinensis]
MEEQDSASRLYRTRIKAENQSFGEIVQTVAEPIQEMDDSQLFGALAVVAGDGVVGDDKSPSTMDLVTTTEKKVKESGGGKKKRGRPQGVLLKPPASKKKKEEEDVCFICFDGGSLVLCDRRGCPKAYHPACIKRDEAFFRSKARWNCGWHICSSCQKAAHYMCYTCTYSLCKGCTKGADFLCVRGKKGFCTICMRTIMLIENNEQGNKETALVDFDDKSSWEYLFKVYWIYLKGKLSLTLNELIQAKNLWKGAGTMACKGRSSDLHYGGKGSISDGSPGCLEANISKRRKATEHPELLSKDSASPEKSGSDKGTTLAGCTEWASKELLEFVAHVKNGDLSVLSQFDVQSLLLDYIKRNNLRDPHQKSQIICDLRLKNLFGKPHVDYFEMLQQLEFHFLIKEDSPKDTIIQSNILDDVMSQLEADGNNDDLLMMGKDEGSKVCRKGEERGPQTNLNEYAAIDAHNINLIYLRRNLMENLIEDDENFHDKVVGSVVRIGISGSTQKQDMYRLVQVVGTSKVAVPYKIGKRTVDVMLEILNLDKEEAIAIDAISNQEFSEVIKHTTLIQQKRDECRRLSQSIKCGLVKRWTVGDIQEKAMALQAVRLNDWLDTEILRLNNLHDRASEKGHKKELRECLEKLQLLKKPEERQRRMHEIPEVHAYPHMDPNYESEEDAGEPNDKKQDEYVRRRFTGFSGNVRESISPHKGGDILNGTSSQAWKTLTNCERRLGSTSYSDKEDGPTRALERVNEPSGNEGSDACGLISLEKPGNRVDSTSSVFGDWNNQAVVRSGSFSGVASETSTAPLSAGLAPSASDSETDKLWYYRDPNGKIQGPFSMMELRIWSKTGYFPSDMRIWRISDKQDSLLLTDALKGQFHKSLPSLYDISLQLQKVEGASDSRLYTCDGRWSGTMNTTGKDGKQNEGGWNCNNARALSIGKNKFVRSNGRGSYSSDWTTPVTNYKGVQAGSSSQCQDSFKGNNSCSDQSRVDTPLPLLEFSDRSYGTLSHQGRGHRGERWYSGPNHGNRDLHGTSMFHTTGGHTQGCADQSSGQNWRPLPVNFSSNEQDSSSGFASVGKSTDSSEQTREINIPNLPSPTPKINNGDWEAQAAENKQSVSSGIAVQDSHISDMPSPTRKPSDGDEKGQVAEIKQSVSPNFPVQDSGPSWSSASSLVVGNGAQFSEIAEEWGGCSPAPAKPSVEEWDSGLVSVSSLKPPEVASDHAATPTSNSDHLIHSSPSHPAFNSSSWHSIITELIEFSPLAEESVSDLLAEVDAMESQCGLASPTSAMNCGGELIQGPNNDCFSSFEGLSPTPDPGKSDALSSTGDIQFPSESTTTDEPLGTSQADVIDPVNWSSGQSSTSTEVDGETKPGISINHWEAGSNIQPPVSSTTSQEMIDTGTAQRAGSEAMDTGWGTIQGNMNPDWGGLAQENTNMGWGTGQEIARGNANMNGIASVGRIEWESQPKYGGERFTGSRDSGYQGGDLAFSRVRSSWSWPSSFGGGGGGGGGGGYSRHLPKGQRVCKFYESGHCKKGALCDYRHP